MLRLSADGVKRCARIRGVLESAMRVRCHSPSHAGSREPGSRSAVRTARPSRELEQARMAFARACGHWSARACRIRRKFDAAFDDLFARDAAGVAVEIMTIHKAKGLEFDLVILPALERSIAHRSDEFCCRRNSRVATATAS
jgi:ATP-dependent helicase/nuclease subunit A